MNAGAQLREKDGYGSEGNTCGQVTSLISGV